MKAMKSSMRFKFILPLVMIVAAPLAKLSALPIPGPRFPHEIRTVPHWQVWLPEQVDKKPVLKKGAARPVYPPEMLMKKEAGSATIAFLVTKKGEVEGAKVVKQTGRAFGKAALAAVEQWHYKPAKKNGAVVDCQVVIPIDFTIQGNGSGASNSPAGSDDASDDSK